MARRFQNSALSASVNLSGVNKLTLVFWMEWTNSGGDNRLALEFTSNYNGSTGGFIVNPNSSDSAHLQVALLGDAGYCRANVSRETDGVFHHWAILLDKSKSTNEVDSIYADGVSKSITYTANANNTTNFANDTLYFMSRNAASLVGSGQLAEVAIYPGVLLDASEIASLAKGLSPLMVRPTAKPYYWPLIGRTSPEIELFYGAAATLHNLGQDPETSRHPRIIYPV